MQGERFGLVRSLHQSQLLACPDLSTIRLTLVPLCWILRFVLIPELKLAVGVYQAEVAVRTSTSVAAYACGSIVSFPPPLPVPGLVCGSPEILLEGLVGRSIKQSDRNTVVCAPA